jgi:hypothetical protein
VWILLLLPFVGLLWVPFYNFLEPALFGFPFFYWYLSLSETLSGWRLTENRAMLLFNEGSFQAHWLGGCRSIAVAGSARGRDLDIAAANKRSAADCS